jgi:cytoskeletal protein CcmA (bactofilin family)
LFNKDGLFGKKDEEPRAEPRALHVNVTPELRGTPVRTPTASPTEATPAERLAAAQSAVPAAASDSPGSKLIVGPDIKLKGVEITDCDTLVVEGRVEASMDSRVVEIAKNGIFTGNATMDVAEIRGTFEGQLTVRKQLVIYESGRVSGQIRYGQIRIEEGGELSGDVSTLHGKPSGMRAESAAAPAREPKVARYDTPTDRLTGPAPKTTAPANR